MRAERPTSFNRKWMKKTARSSICTHKHISKDIHVNRNWRIFSTAMPIKYQRENICVFFGENFISNFFVRFRFRDCVTFKLFATNRWQLVFGVLCLFVVAEVFYVFLHYFFFKVIRKFFFALVVFTVGLPLEFIHKWRLHARQSIKFMCFY